MTSPLADVSLHLVETVDDAMALRRWLGERHDGPLGIDTESGGLHFWRHQLRLIQVGDRRTGWAIPWERWGGVALEVMNAWDGDWITHNGPFDWKFIAHHTGFELPWHRTDDTLTMARLDNPVRQNGLKPLSTSLLDRRAGAGQKALEEGFQENKWDWASVPVNYPPYWQYSALDPVLTAHLREYFAPRIAADCPDAYDLERAANRLCTLMSMKGMLVDVPYVEKSIDSFEKNSAEIRAWLKSTHQITSPKSGGQLRRAFERLGQEILFWTDQNAPQFNKEALAFYENQGQNGAVQQLAKYIRAVRHIEDIKDRYSRKFLELRDANDLIHANINVMGARTGRMSVSDPALQQLPRDDKVIRGSFIPRPGHVFISCDLDQIEARLAAHFSQDEGLIQAFLDADSGGADFFCGIASGIFGESITKEDKRRQLTKNTVYGSLYSAGVETMARTAGVSVAQMDPVKKAFDERFPGLPRYSNQLVRESRQNDPPSIRGPLGRLLIADRGRETTQILNAQIQSHAAELMKQFLTRIDAAGLGDAMVLVVHDEALLEVPVEDAKEVLRTVTEAMTERHAYRVPLTAGGKIMEDRWAK